MKTDRVNALLSYIKESGEAPLEDLMGHFKISMSTLRRDLKFLEDNGDIDRYYGGVRIRKRKELTPLSSRMRINISGKARIGRLAAQLVREGDVIFLDSGSTAGEMSKYITGIDSLTVVTNNLLAITALASSETVQLITLSGVYNPKTSSFVGDRVSEILNEYNIGKAFMGTSGLTTSGLVTHSTALEALVKRTAVQTASTAVLLADHLKFDRAAPFTYANLDSIDKVVTDEQPSDEFMQLFAKHLVKVEVAPPDGDQL
ncbi:MAG: DeoR/GlpR family DNA-binding transcription regulator [Aeromonadales bacterium]|nr:DeoR/GlpR family DNA-binding transcription regulator [Aeromonadales bacterium]MDY2891786.1 DeoR/GlpR family DNA-binding transcription regulator [Succinivibrio sp.]